MLAYKRRVEDGGYTGSSFRAALEFMALGLRLHDQLIVEVTRQGAWARNRWMGVWDYCFIFSKGKPRVFNPICDKPNIWAGSTAARNPMGRVADALGNPSGIRAPIPSHSKRTGIWRYSAPREYTLNPTKHPAVMPYSLAMDLIRAYSNASDLVLDPFSGSATTARAAQVLGGGQSG